MYEVSKKYLTFIYIKYIYLYLYDFKQGFAGS